MVTVVSDDGVKVKFDRDELFQWDIFEAQSNRKIGSLEVDCDGMVVGADIDKQHQRKGIATAVVKYLVEECAREFYFWPPDGQTYDDARHLSEEGVCLANSLVRKRLAHWIATGPCLEDEAF